MEGYELDRDGTERRTRAVEAYLTEHVLDSELNELCGHAATCRSSTRHPYAYGLLPHVGQAFDLREQGQPMRILVVGLDWGGAEPQTMAQRRAEFDIIGAHAVRNPGPGDRRNLSPHLGGTEQALRTLLGMPEGTGPGTRDLPVDGSPRNLYQCFAFMNRTLCSAAVGTSSRTTATMRRHCTTHLKEVIDRLEPTHIIFQGGAAGADIEALLPDTCAVQGDPDGARVYLHRHGVAYWFSHPEARGGRSWNFGRSRYFEDAVRPTLLEYRRTPWLAERPGADTRAAVAGAIVVGCDRGDLPDYIDLVPRLLSGPRWRFPSLAREGELAIMSAAVLAQEILVPTRRAGQPGRPSERLIAREIAPNDPEGQDRLIERARDAVSPETKSAHADGRLGRLTEELARQLVWSGGDARRLGQLAAH
ncbi:hypothetical protein CKO28_09015 [Rhodovibrio sodomensis]|uniref:Uracil-DNA glycosylase-like domain-containing protein n=1 Tax=Rhodovibrio sodomensis TaxID=1088 RepID=A0ABS1DCI9_9PROT|nr:hypothetical protein [Rhodovibrio sodomensis]MBK1668176.1 hypothetical protein [Rhodovibrio sodomensis]